MSNRIAEWAVEDRPRERLERQGRGNLSDAELVAILLGSGSQGQTAVELARSILKKSGNDLNQLAKWDLETFCAFKGMGKAKSIRLLAAIELGLRRQQHKEVSSEQPITSSKQAADWISPKLRDLGHEEFWVLFLNRANKIIDISCISKGGLTGTLADGRIIFRMALEKKACALILAHNHPSGNLKPSEADKSLTRKLMNAGQFVDIQVLDHIIIAGEAYFSFCDDGLL
jgi:DNA repair protein RadC